MSYDVFSEDQRDKNDSWVEALSRLKVCIRTFGCAYNEGDSSRLATILESKGCTIVKDPSDADAIILNTCIVIETTERKMVKEILSYDGRQVFVTGCLPLARPELCHSWQVTGVINPDSIHRLSDEISPKYADAVCVIQVGPGCTGSCRYCITRVARGYMRSIPEESIIQSIGDASGGGVVEIRLAGQDLSSYGHDIPGFSLVTLMRGVPRLAETCKIRTGMMNPVTLLPIAEEVAQAMRDGPFFHFLHLPVQSGSDRVLEMMGRGYTVHEVLEIVDLFRSVIPGITIATDFITGFPGETEADHLASVGLMERMRPGMVNVTRYSWRPGTGMGREGELPERIRKDRSRELIRISYAAMLASNEKTIGSIEKVVVTEALRAGSVMARTGSYGGVVIQGEYPPGTQLYCRITRCTPHYRIGEPVNR